MIKKILLLYLNAVIFSCSSYQPTISNKKLPNKSRKTSGTINKSSTSFPSNKNTSTTAITNQYIIEFKEIAMSNMKNYGIPASIILAQGILESGSGRSVLASSANNHFGIKCSNDWTGERAYKDDDSSQECFRKYNNPGQSYKDHSDILSKRKRYSFLFNLNKSDYVSWAKGLKEAGYATDPSYPEKLIGYIENYQLNKYDNIVLKNISSTNKEKTNIDRTKQDYNSVEYIVEQGDTLYSISKKFNISINELKKQNNIENNKISIGQYLTIQK